MIMRNLFQFVTAFTTMVELERIFFKEMMMMMMNRDVDLCQGLLFQGLGQAIQRLSRRPLGVTTTPRNPKFHLCSKQSLPAMVWWGWSHYIKHKTKKPVIQIPICWKQFLVATVWRGWEMCRTTAPCNQQSICWRGRFWRCNPAFCSHF